ncbi:MAG: hypothetical protein V4733_11135 [Verrucomicrobiota bacterium]
MNWIFDNLQIVIIVLIGLASVAKRIFDARTPGPDSLPDPRRMDGDEEDGWEMPAPPSLPRPAPPVFQPADEQLLARQIEMRERLRAAKAARAKAAVDRPVYGAKPAAVSSGSALSRSLHNRGELRRAVILREILGPPIGLK